MNRANIAFVREALLNNPREKAWDLIARNVPLGPLAADVRRLRADIKRLRLPPYNVRGAINPRRKRYDSKFCRGCGALRSEHKVGSPTNRNHMRTIRLRYQTALGWARKTEEQRYADSQRARDGRRRKFLRRLLERVDPRIVHRMGEQALLERLDREHPPRKPRPNELAAGYYRRSVPDVR